MCPIMDLPMIEREPLDPVRADYKIREARVRKRIFEMVKAGCCEPCRGSGSSEETQNPARFQLINASNSQGSGALLSSDAPHA
jgi:hypothetical protein